MEEDLIDFSDDPLEDHQIWSDSVDNPGYREAPSI